MLVREHGLSFRTAHAVAAAVVKLAASEGVTADGISPGLVDEARSHRKRAEKIHKRLQELDATAREWGERRLTPGGNDGGDPLDSWHARVRGGSPLDATEDG